MARRVPQQGKIIQWLYGEQGVSWGHDPEDYSPEAIAGTLKTAKRLFGPGKYFDMEVRGMDHIPDETCMVVSNHSGGTSIPDAWGLMVAWYEHFGLQRPLQGLAHEMVFSTPVTGPYFARRGILHADRDLAIEALREWKRDIVVMPGGDLDTWRPYPERYQVRFSGRTGYARTAIQAGVPVIPVAHAGAHETLVVLSDGRRLAKRLRLDKIARASIFPVHLSLPYGLAIGPMPHLPPPMKLRYRVGEPVYPTVHCGPDEEPPAEAVQAMDEAVRASIQAMLDELASERVAPLERVADRLKRGAGRVRGGARRVRGRWRRARGKMER